MGRQGSSRPGLSQCVRHAYARLRHVLGMQSAAADRWIRAARKARRQFGTISLAQLLDCGFSQSAVSRAVRAGHLIPLHRGVYALAYQPTDQRASLVAGTLAGGDGSVVSRRTAARYLRFVRWAPGAISITAPTQRRHQPGLVFHAQVLHPRETFTHRGVPCSTPARTFFDLATEDIRVAEQAIQGASGIGMLDADDALELIERHPGERGVARLRRIFLGHERVPLFTRSELERRMHRLCSGGALDEPDMNVLVYGADGQPYECDAVWPAARLIVECDSAWHDNPISAREDAERDEQLTLAGWRVFRMRWSQIALQPARTAATIRHLLAEQQRLLIAAA